MKNNEYIPKKYRNDKMKPKIQIDKKRNELGRLIKLLLREIEPFKIIISLSELPHDRYNKEWDKVINDFPSIILNLEYQINSIYFSMRSTYFINKNLRHDLIWISLNWERFDVIQSVFELYDNIKNSK